MCLVRYFFRYLFKLLCSFSAYLMCFVRYFFRYFFNLLSSFSAYFIRCAFWEISSATFSTYCLHFPHIWLVMPYLIFFPLLFQLSVFIFRIFDKMCFVWYFASFSSLCVILGTEEVSDKTCTPKLVKKKQVRQQESNKKR